MIDTNQPPVSIVIPIYNGMPFIVRTIDSVRSQTYPHWELILCDNVSKDDTVPALKRYLGDNWNRSLTYARGDFVKLLPADDILLLNCLEIQARLLNEHNDVGFVSSGKEVIDSRGRTYLTLKRLREGRYEWSGLGCKLIRAVVNLIGEPGGVLFRRELIKECGLFDSRYRYLIDLEMYLRFLKNSNLYISENPLYQFRTHANSESASSRRISVQEHAQLLETYGAELGLSGRPLLKAYLRQKAHLVSLARSLAMQIHHSN
jgi:glycosyltransferase involved in cell wall biosynthesis